MWNRRFAHPWWTSRTGDPTLCRWRIPRGSPNNWSRMFLQNCLCAIVLFPCLNITQGHDHTGHASKTYSYNSVICTNQFDNPKLSRYCHRCRIITAWYPSWRRCTIRNHCARWKYQDAHRSESTKRWVACLYWRRTIDPPLCYILSSWWHARARATLRVSGTNNSLYLKKKSSCYRDDCIGLDNLMK